MKQLRQTIFGAALILSGSIGIALGNLEETIYHSGTESYGHFIQSPGYWMSWAFLFLGLAAVITAAMKPKKKSR
ncbi:MAG: hypothetical protein CVU86_07590 [Firmicutes bacterium HGW-Firmicutes-11]|jgi:hypothetical protein|nr:MAG: hypothetical protein CVU86_07590 [Firmicutes bacterium HGW-Firmicutes-11]